MANRDRAPVSSASIVAAARELLARGGTENVTLRELAGSLGVSAPALYKHVSGGRAEIVDLLAAACLDELTGEVAAARDAVPPADSRGRFLAAALAWWRWSRRHTAEHALLFATPALPFERPAGGRSAQAGVRLGRVFVEIAAAAAAAGHLRDDGGELPAGVAAQLRRWAAGRGLERPGGGPLTGGQLWTVVRGFQDLMGLVLTDSSGQLGFALSDTDAYMAARLAALAADVVRA